MARPGAGGVQKGPAGAAGPVDDLLGQLLDLGAVVGLRIGNQFHQAGPAAADAQNAVAFAQRAKVTARIAGFSPGTSPPPVKIPMVPLFVPYSVSFAAHKVPLSIRSYL